MFVGLEIHIRSFRVYLTGKYRAILQETEKFLHSRPHDEGVEALCNNITAECARFGWKGGDRDNINFQAFFFSNL